MKILFGLYVSFGLLFASIDINTANEKELASLKGISSLRAKAIIKYRDTYCFKKVQDLSKVKGIGKKTLEKNMDNLSVSSCK